MRQIRTSFFPFLTLIAGLLLGFGVSMGAYGWFETPTELTPSYREARTEPVGGCLDPLRQHTVALVEMQQTLTALTTAVRNSPASHRQSARETVTPARESLPRDDLAELIRESIRETLKTLPPEVSPSENEREETSAEPSPENLQAFDTAYNALSDALASGRWTEQEASALRQQLGGLTSAQYQEVFQLLMSAINNGDIVVETPGSIW